MSIQKIHWGDNTNSNFEDITSCDSPVAISMGAKTCFGKEDLYLLNIGTTETNPSTNDQDKIRNYQGYARYQFMLCALNNTTYAVPYHFLKKVAMVFTLYHFCCVNPEAKCSNKLILWVKDIARIILLPIAWPILIATALFAAIYPSASLRNTVATLQSALLENEEYDKLRAMTAEEIDLFLYDNELSTDDNELSTNEETEQLVTDEETEKLALNKTLSPTNTTTPPTNTTTPPTNTTTPRDPTSLNTNSTSALSPTSSSTSALSPTSSKNNVQETEYPSDTDYETLANTPLSQEQLTQLQKTFSKEELESLEQTFEKDIFQIHQTDSTPSIVSAFDGFDTQVTGPFDGVLNKLDTALSNIFGLFGTQDTVSHNMSSASALSSSPNPSTSPSTINEQPIATSSASALSSSSSPTITVSPVSEQSNATEDPEESPTEPVSLNMSSASALSSSSSPSHPSSTINEQPTATSSAGTLVSSSSQASSTWPLSTIVVTAWRSLKRLRQLGASSANKQKKVSFSEFATVIDNKMLVPTKQPLKHQVKNPEALAASKKERNLRKAAFTAKQNQNPGS